MTISSLLVVAGAQGGMAVAEHFRQKRTMHGHHCRVSEAANPAGLDPAVYPERFPIHQQWIRGIEGSAVKAGSYHLLWRNLSLRLRLDRRS